MWDHDEKATLRELLHACIELVHDLTKALKKYLAETPPASTTLKGNLMANYQLNTGDSVVVAFTDSDNVTGAAVVIDPGSVTAVLSDTTDSVVIDPSGTFATITAGTSLAVGKTVTVNATVGGIASGPSGGWVGAYDVVAAVVTPDATTLVGTFGTESAPTLPGTVASSPATAPVSILLASGRTIQAGTPLPAGTKYVAATNELVNLDGTSYLG
jgi:hypothetical protein